jgi:hypothetical protein
MTTKRIWCSLSAQAVIRVDHIQKKFRDDDYGGHGRFPPPWSIEETEACRDIGGGEVMETRWRPPTKAEVREIVRRYREAQAKVPPFDVIEFERHLQPGAAGKFFGDDGEGAARPAAAA